MSCCICLGDDPEFSCRSCLKGCHEECLRDYCLTRAQIPDCPDCKSPIAHETLYDLDPKKYSDWIGIFQKKIPLQIIAENTKLRDLDISLVEIRKQMKDLTKIRVSPSELESTKKKAEGQFLELINKRRHLELGLLTPESRSGLISCVQPECSQLVDSTGFCRICKTVTCLLCRNIKKEGHVCDSGDLSSVKIITESSKSCPNCRTMIEKEAGCNQMWCTMCNTAFNWETQMVISTRNYHNDHYIEFLRKRGTKIDYNLDQCDELIPLDVVLARAGEEFKELYEFLTELSESEREDFPARIATHEKNRINSLRHYFRDGSYTNLVNMGLYQNTHRINLYQNLREFIQLILPIGIHLINSASKDNGNLDSLNELRKFYKEREEKLRILYPTRYIF